MDGNDPLNGCLDCAAAGKPGDATPQGEANDPTLNETIADLTGQTNRAAHGDNEKGMGIGECQGGHCIDSSTAAKAGSLAVLADKISDLLSGVKAGAKAAVKWAGKGAKSLAKRGWNSLKSLFKKRPKGTGCFVAGTIVELEHGSVPIEHVKLGARTTGTSDSCGVLPRYGWARVDVEMLNASGAFHGEASFLLQTHELAEELIADGQVIPFSVDENLLREVAKARVLQISLDQELEAGVGCPVTATFKSTSIDLAEVWIDELDAPIQATGGHLFYSASREEWVPAADLVAGEWLDTSAGIRTVERVVYQANHVEPVFTLEVADVHEFRVGELGARSHNADVCPKVSSRAARRGAMRDEGIPTSQQPVSQSRNQSGRSYEYKVDGQQKSVQQQTMDRSHPGQGHWEAGSVKTDPVTGGVRMNQHGRPKLTNQKSKRDYDE